MNPKMVDTVHFRIHDLYANKELVGFLNQPGKGQERRVKVMEGTFDPMKEIFMKRIYIDYTAGNSYPEHYKAFIQSHNYEIHYEINYNRDFIEIALSLPKYWFGNNLCQLVDHWFDDNFLKFKLNPWWQCTPWGYDRFRTVFNHFLDGCLVHPIKKEFIEILRIDICYNLVLRNEADTRFYMSEIESIKRKRWAKTQSGLASFKAGADTNGIYYSSRDFTFKIYHKGDEFKKHDYHKIKKRFGEEVAKRIWEHANCVLRYEMEFRPGMMSQLFVSDLKNHNWNLYRACAAWRYYDKMGYVKLSDGSKASVDGWTNKAAVSDSTKQPLKKLGPELRKRLSVGKYLLSKDIRFFAGGNLSDSLRSETKLNDIVFTNGKPTGGYGFKEVFEYSVFDLCVKKFKEYFDHFQISHIDNLDKIDAALKKNEERSVLEKFLIDKKVYGNLRYHDKLSEGRIKQIILLLKQYSWDEIKSKELFGKSTFYRYKKFFDNCGIAQKTTNNNFGVDFSYSRYYDLIFSDFQSITHRQSFPK